MVIRLRILPFILAIAVFSNCLWVKVETREVTLHLEKIREWVENRVEHKIIIEPSCEGQGNCRLRLYRKEIRLSYNIQEVKEKVKYIRRLPDEFTFYYFYFNDFEEAKGAASYFANLGIGIFTTLGTNLVLASFDYLSLPFRLIDSELERVRRHAELLGRSENEQELTTGHFTLDGQHFPLGAGGFPVTRGQLIHLMSTGNVPAQYTDTDGNTLPVEPGS